MNRRKQFCADAHDAPATRVTNPEHECTPLRADLLNPGRLLQEIVASFRPLAEQKGLGFEVASYPDWHDVIADAPKVRHVVATVLENAIRHTSAGWVRLEFWPPTGNHWGIVVEDTGSGMAAGEAGRIFEKRRHLSAATTRSGASAHLSSCKELVGRLRGTISLHSRPGQGTRVEIRLPVMVARHT